MAVNPYDFLENNSPKFRKPDLGQADSARLVETGRSQDQFVLSPNSKI